MRDGVIPFYMDEHVPKAITNGLRLQSIDVLTVQEDGRTGIPDDLVLERAIELQRIFFHNNAKSPEKAAKLLD